MILSVIMTIFGILAFNQIFSNSEQVQQILQGEKINIIEIINQKIINVNKYLITINPSAKILLEESLLKNILNISKIFL